jgi:hypothetical protein
VPTLYSKPNVVLRGPVLRSGTFEAGQSASKRQEETPHLEDPIAPMDANQTESDGFRWKAQERWNRYHPYWLGCRRESSLVDVGSGKRWVPQDDDGLARGWDLQDRDGTGI